MERNLITAYDRQSIMNRQIQALVRQELERQQAEREAATAKRLAEQDRKIRELEERLKSKARRVDSLCGQLMETLPEPEPLPRRGLSDLLWGLWGLALLAFDKYNARAVEFWYTL